MSLFSGVPVLGPALTAPGTNAANKQSAQQAGVGKWASDSLLKSGGFGDQVNAEQKFNYNLLPQKQAAIGNYLASFSPQAETAAANSEKNALISNNRRAYSQMGVSNPGAGAGLLGGNELALANADASGSNQIDQKYGDPRYHAQRILQMLQGFGMANPDFNGVNSLIGAVYGQPQAKVGTGLGDIVGGIAGQAIGSGAWRI